MGGDERAYRDALGAYATGVAVVTVSEGAGVHGMTINSFASVSLSPKLVLWSLGDRSERYDQYAGADAFGLTVLGADAMAMAALCAGKGREALAGEHVARLGEVPVLKNGIARLACRTHERRILGDHLVIVGEVIAFDMRAGDGLTYFRSAYGKAALA